MPAGALISGAFGLASNAANIVAEDYRLDKQHEYNKETMALQNQYNIEAAERQQGYNEKNAALSYQYGEQAADAADARTRKMTEDFWKQYNSPEAQARALKEAGLSVGLMYGNNGSAGGVSTPAGAQGTGATVENPNVQANQAIGDVAVNPLQGVNLAMGWAQVAKIMAETKAIKGGEKRSQDLHTGNLQLQQLGIKNSQYDANLKNIDLLFQTNTLESRQEAIKLNNKNTLAQLEKTLFETNASKQKLDLELKTLEENWKKIQNENAILKIQEEWQDKLNEAQIKHLTSNWQTFVFGDRKITDFFEGIGKGIEDTTRNAITTFFEEEKEQNTEINEIFNEAKKGNKRGAIKRFLNLSATQNNDQPWRF